MTESIRVRFAPSPTGQVHIGNIRAAIFNYLFARSQQGRFLLRVEDTDRLRSTPEAVEKLMEVMDWLELRADEEPLFQSTRADAHLQAAEDLIQKGHAYRYARTEEESPAVYFRFPVDATVYGEHIRTGEVVEKALFPGQPLKMDHTGIQYVGVSRKGKQDPGACCLAGMADAEVLDATGVCLFGLRDALPRVLADGECFETDAAVTLRFTQRELVFQDLVKGELTKPLDSMKDLVIVRGDGSPVFHLANVCDDVEQRVSHIIRGDDHVENTFRHLPLFQLLAGKVPQYGHLPMIVNEQGKPYSKRDGDAFVGDFRDKGYLPEALFNYLVLLGWSPGDDREKMNRDELISAFSLDRVQQSPAHKDEQNLGSLNGAYLQELPVDLYLADVRDLLSRQPWADTLSFEKWTEVGLLMRPRIQTYAEVLEWEWFAGADFERDPKAVKRGLGKAWQRDVLARLIDEMENGATLGGALEKVATSLEMDESKLNLPLRVGLTGRAAGPDLESLLAILDTGSFIDRFKNTLACATRADT
ncbi:MAG: glutamate--tRNA ligase family protein [Kiritimatiellae bacterium]|jgi:glutamyl/glutaminyl-tRNA synthetase|nr:glutamate--tRNA ligase family protein [Kiritimatiellia bacterium]